MNKRDIEKRAIELYIGDNESDQGIAVNLAIEISNAQLDELIKRLDTGYKDYAWYSHLRKEIESLKLT